MERVESAAQVKGRKVFVEMARSNLAHCKAGTVDQAPSHHRVPARNHTDPERAGRAGEHARYTRDFGTRMILLPSTSCERDPWEELPITELLCGRSMTQSSGGSFPAALRAARRHVDEAIGFAYISMPP